MSNSVLQHLAAEPWAMEPSRLAVFLTDLRDVSARDVGEDRGALAAITANGTARIPIHGVILKSADHAKQLRRWGMGATSTVEVERAIGAAIADESVNRIVLDIDSPGGTVAGVQDLADTVALAGGYKQVDAEISDLCASAAYWVASQADHISANRSASVGSIGVYTVVGDFSRMFENAGVKVHVVSSHELKGAGVFGAAVTPPQLEDIRRNIIGYASLFEGAVRTGRDMTEEQSATVATGQVWLAEEALALGLIDSVRQHKSETAATVAILQPAALAQQPQSGATEHEMADNTVDATAQVAELQAKLEETKAEVERMKSTQRDATIARYQDRIAPASLAAVKKLGAEMEPAEFEKMLHALPVVVRSERESAAPEASQPADPRLSIPAGEEKVAEVLNMTKTDLDFFSRVVSFSRDGKFRLNDGRIVTRAQLNEMHAEWTKKNAGRLMGVFAALALSLFAVKADAAALSAARFTECKGSGVTRACLMTASKTVYSGGLVMLTSAGTCEAAAASASNHGVVGVAQETKTSESSGSYWLKYTDNVVCKFAGTTLGQDDVGALVYAEDDQTVDETAGSNEPVAGVLYQYSSASLGWVYINSAVNCGRVNTITDPLTLTDVLTLENGGTIENDTNNEIQLAEGSEDISFGFATSNEVTVTSDTGVTRVDFESIGVKTATPLFLVDSQMFCGQGANGATPSYIGPVLVSTADNMTTYVFGAAGCDSLDSTTESTADAIVSQGALKVIGMQCLIDDGGTDDVYTFQLRDDTADVTGVTCTVTLDGSGNDVCTVILDAPVTVAASSTMAVKQSAATDDNCSACDTECRVFFTF